MTRANPNDTGVFSLAADAVVCGIFATVEKPCRGVRLPTPTQHRGFDAVISSTATGLDAFLYDECNGPRITTYTRDSFSTLDYAQNRYYASAYGRFNTVDPGHAGAHPKNPGSWNAYAYVGGDPVNRNDPKGLCVEDNQYNYWDDAPPDGVWILQDLGDGACSENQTFLEQVNGDSGGVSLNGGTYDPTAGSNVGGTITFTATGTCGDDSVVGCGGSGILPDPCYSASNSNGCLGFLGGDPLSPSAGGGGGSSCIMGALGSGLLHVGIDAIGLIPEGGLVSRLIDRALDFRGIVAGNQTIGAVQMATGISTTGLGASETSSTGLISTGLGVGGIAATLGGALPIVGQLISGLSILNDLYGSGKAVANCN